jgi:hypothetical protein
MVLIIDRHFPKSSRLGFDFRHQIVLGGPFDGPDSSRLMKTGCRNFQKYRWPIEPIAFAYWSGFSRGAR